MLSALPDVAAPRDLFGQSCSQDEVAALLERVGYSATGDLKDKLGSFRQRFIPASKGPPNAADRLMLLKYLNDYPVDRSDAQA